jgi:cytochrome P450
MSDRDCIVDNNWKSAEVIADPYEHFGRLRESEPVHWNVLMNMWVVTRHEDVTAIVRQPQCFSSAAPELPEPAEFVPPVAEVDWGLIDFLGAWDQSLINQDRPVHSAIRQAVHRWFTPRAVESWRARLRETAQGLIQSHVIDGELDVKDDFAVLLPLQTISMMLDVPESDAGQLQSLSAKVVAVEGGVEPDRARTAVRALFELEDYFVPLIEARRGSDSDSDLISLLAAAEAHGEFDRYQCLATVVLLLVAGHETTANLICNGVVSFARNPDQWEAFRADPAGLCEQTVEECLRFEPSIKALNRLCIEETELGGQKISPGERVLWVIAAANRDPRVFENPDKFDIFRQPNRHVTFGGGIHHCLGAALARIEGQEAFSTLAERVPELRLKEEQIEYVPSAVMREVRDLHLVLD